jgi:hypothetical protein
MDDLHVLRLQENIVAAWTKGSLTVSDPEDFSLIREVWIAFKNTSPQTVSWTLPLPPSYASKDLKKTYVVELCKYTLQYGVKSKGINTHTWDWETWLDSQYMGTLHFTPLTQESPDSSDSDTEVEDSPLGTDLTPFHSQMESHHSNGPQPKMDSHHSNGPHLKMENNHSNKIPHNMESSHSNGPGTNPGYQSHGEINKYSHQMEGKNLKTKCNSAQKEDDMVINASFIVKESEITFTVETHSASKLNITDILMLISPQPKATTKQKSAQQRETDRDGCFYPKGLTKGFGINGKACRPCLDELIDTMLNVLYLAQATVTINETGMAVIKPFGTNSSQVINWSSGGRLGAQGPSVLIPWGKNLQHSSMPFEMLKNLIKRFFINPASEHRRDKRAEKTLSLKRATSLLSPTRSSSRQPRDTLKVRLNKEIVKTESHPFNTSSCRTDQMSSSNSSSKEESAQQGQDDDAEQNAPHLEIETSDRSSPALDARAPSPKQEQQGFSLKFDPLALDEEALLEKNALVHWLSNELKRGTQMTWPQYRSKAPAQAMLAALVACKTEDNLKLIRNGKAALSIKGLTDLAVAKMPTNLNAARGTVEELVVKLQRWLDDTPRRNESTIRKEKESRENRKSKPRGEWGARRPGVETAPEIKAPPDPSKQSKRDRKEAKKTARREAAKVAAPPPQKQLTSQEATFRDFLAFQNREVKTEARTLTASDSSSEDSSDSSDSESSSSSSSEEDEKKKKKRKRKARKEKKKGKKDKKQKLKGKK